MSAPRRFATLLVAVFVALIGLVVGSASSSAIPYTHNPHITCNPRANVHSVVHCSGDGYLANDDVEITLHTVTYTLGSAHTDGSGAFHNKALRLPDGVTGVHTITGTGRGGAPTDSASTQILIVAPGSSGTGGTGTGGSGNGGLSSTGVAVVALAVVGAGLVVAGGIMVLGGRRRRRALV